MKRILRSIALTAMLFVWMPVQAQAAGFLVPVGEVIGLQLGSDTLTVVAYDDALGAAARDAGLKIGDELVKIGEKTIGGPEDIRSALKTQSSDVILTVRRGSKLSTLHMTPCQTEDGPRLGVYLRQGIAGIGTVTYYDPETGCFGTLGHGVNNSKGGLLNMTEGSVYTASVQSVKKGKSGEPGQLKGSADGSVPFGVLLRNTDRGVFGISTPGWQGQPVPVAEFEEVQTGPAVIRSTVSGGTPREYSVEILKIYPQTRSDARNFLLKVTDPQLLELTGGIVQGMSGSPILQNGKLIGAVTHVLVSDAATGYGIYIGNMLDAAA